MGAVVHTVYCIYKKKQRWIESGCGDLKIELDACVIWPASADGEIVPLGLIWVARVVDNFAQQLIAAIPVASNPIAIEWVEPKQIWMHESPLPAWVVLGAPARGAPHDAFAHIVLQRRGVFRCFDTAANACAVLVARSLSCLSVCIVLSGVALSFRARAIFAASACVVVPAPAGACTYLGALPRRRGAPPRALR